MLHHITLIVIKSVGGKPIHTDANTHVHAHTHAHTHTFSILIQFLLHVTCAIIALQFENENLFLHLQRVLENKTTIKSIGVQ